MREKVLFVTGANGFIGQNLIHSLQSDSEFSLIYLSVRRPQAFLEKLARQGVVLDPQIFQVVEGWEHSWGLKKVRATHILHLAGLRPGKNQNDYVSVHLWGTRRLFDEMRGTERVIILSSQSVLGAGVGPTPLEDSSVAYPLGWDGIIKLEMERMLQEEFSSRQYIVLRPSMVIGKGDHLGKTLCGLEKFPLAIKLGVEEKQYSFIAIEDLVRAIRKCLRDTRDWRRWNDRAFLVSSFQTVTDGQILSSPRWARGRSVSIIGIPQGKIRALTGLVNRFPALAKRVPWLHPARFREIAPHWWVVNADRFCETFQWESEVDFTQAIRNSLEN